MGGVDLQAAPGLAPHPEQGQVLVELVPIASHRLLQLEEGPDPTVGHPLSNRGLDRPAVQGHSSTILLRSYRPLTILPTFPFDRSLLGTLAKGLGLEVVHLPALREHVVK